MDAPKVMPAMTESPTLAVDLGKTSCRIRVSRGGEALAEVKGPGAPGVAEQHGARLSAESILAQLDRIDPALLRGLSGAGVGAAGVEAAPEATAEFIALLRARLGCPIAVINDALAAHAGAFSGGPGLVLIAGTGAIAYHVGADGSTAQIDGWGPWLGDAGSGRWIGQEGLTAVLRALDGRGDATALSADAGGLLAEVSALPGWVSATGAPARQLASFAPAVLDRAAGGDAVAREIVERAAAHLAETAAAPGTAEVCVVGGISEHPYFAARLEAALLGRGLRVRAIEGDALAGAAIVARRRDLGYEEHIFRG